MTRGIAGLAANHLGAEGMQCFADASNVWPPSLTRVDLSSNHIQNAGLEVLAASLRASSCPIRELILSSNAIGGHGIAALAQALGPKSKLSHLDMSENNIQAGSEFAQLVQAISASPHLKELRLGGNRVGQSVFTTQPSLLSHSTLTSLDLSCNGICSKAVDAFAKLLCETQISTLNVRGNDLLSDSLQPLFEALQSNSSLTILDLDYSCGSSRELPATFALTRLQSGKGSKRLAGWNRLQRISL